MLWLAGFVACATPLRAQETAPIPEPDITYLGSVPAGSEVAIEHAAGGLDADTATASEPYLLTVRLVQPVLAPTPALPPVGSAYVGDMATVLVNGVAQGRVTLAERGAIFRLDIPNPARTPSPNALLSPVRIGSTIPPFSCGAMPCTPTPGQPGTPTATRTVTATAGAGTGTPTPTTTPTPSPTPGVPACVGDCSDDARVSIDELVRSVNVALGNLTLDVCAAIDRNANGAVTIDEIIAAVNNALNGCPVEAP